MAIGSFEEEEVAWFEGEGEDKLALSPPGGRPDNRLQRTVC